MFSIPDRFLSFTAEVHTNSVLLLSNTMSAPRVLLIGGHGKVSMLLTPMLLKQSWNVTSLIRNPDQAEEIKALGKSLGGKLDVLIESLDDVKSDQEAQNVLDQVKPDYVVWSAGWILTLRQMALY